MTDKNWDVLDPPRSKLRALAAALQQQVTQLDGAATASATQVAGVVAAWDLVSAALALEPEPTLRDCPHCQRRVLAEATRCRYCMAVSPAAAKGTAA